MIRNLYLIVMIVYIAVMAYAIFKFCTSGPSFSDWRPIRDILREEELKKQNKKMEQNANKMATNANKEHYTLNFRNFSIYTGIVFLFGTITGMVIAHMLYCGTL